MKDYTSLEYIQISVASHYGLDKQSFEKRLKWTIQNDSELEAYTHTAENPFQYQAAIIALRDVQANKPTGYLVGLDACSSVIQMMSALMGDPVGAKNSGITGKSRKDVYSITTDTMNSLLKHKIPVSRKEVKEALMTGCYGSTAVPKRVFGEDTPELEAFYEAADTVAPGAMKMLTMCLYAWQNKYNHTWIMPDFFTCHIPVLIMKDFKIEVDELDHKTFTYRTAINEPQESGLSLAANITHSVDSLIVREMGRRLNYNKTKVLIAKSICKKRLSKPDIEPSEPIELIAQTTGFISLVQIEDLTPHEVAKYSLEYTRQLLIQIDRVLAKPSFQILFIHDEFKVHANYMNYVRWEYINIVAEIAESNILSSILSNITNNSVTIKKSSKVLGNKIRFSEYALS